MKINNKNSISVYIVVLLLSILLNIFNFVVIYMVDELLGMVIGMLTSALVVSSVINLMKLKNTSSSLIDTRERLKNLSTLKEEGLISDLEYEKKRLEIIDKDL